MKKLLERLKVALDNLDEKDFQLIEDASVFYESAIEQIVKHLEWMVSRKSER